MEKLIISDEQKSKLVEMCKDLFVEYNDVKFEIHYSANEKNDVVESLLFFKNSVEYSKIPWFEVCVVYLPEKIAECLNTVYPNEKQALIVDLMMKKMLTFSVIEYEHPADYLYEIYKKV